MIKRWLGVIFFALFIPFIIGIFALYAKADGVIPQYFNDTLTVPILASSNKFYEATLLCDSDITECKVVHVREICNPDRTNFSPSVVCAESIKILGGVND